MSDEEYTFLAVCALVVVACFTTASLTTFFHNMQPDGVLYKGQIEDIAYSPDGMATQILLNDNSIILVRGICSFFNENDNVTIRIEDGWIREYEVHGVKWSNG